MRIDSRSARLARSGLWLVVVAALAGSLWSIRRQGWSFGPFLDLVRSGFHRHSGPSATVPSPSKHPETASVPPLNAHQSPKSAGLTRESSVLQGHSQSLPTATSRQSSIWQNVRTEKGGTHLNSMILSATQLANIKKAIKDREQLDLQGCAEEEPDWVDKVFFQELPVAETETVLLVEAGPGCARGGQGANGAMWVVRLADEKVSFLATPQQNFDGFLYSVQPTTSHGLRDLVLGWHISSGETDLGYFSFDGSSYRWVGNAVLLVASDGTRKIVTDR